MNRKIDNGSIKYKFIYAYINLKIYLGIEWKKDRKNDEYMYVNDNMNKKIDN